MPLETEQWKPVRGYEGLYEISDRGRIRAIFKGGNFHKPGRILKPWLLKTGYLQVHLMRPREKRKAFCIHRLLLEAFAGPPPEKCEVRHLNGDRSDNSLVNLAWGTHKQNAEDMYNHGRCQCGEKMWASKLTADDVRRIRKMRESGMTALEIAPFFGIHYSNVYYVTSKRTWKHI